MNIGSIIGVSLLLVVLFFVFKTPWADASKIEVLYPPAGEVKICQSFCKAESPHAMAKGARLKLERTFNGVAWACECKF